MILDADEIIVLKFPVQHGEQCLEAFRGKSLAVIGPYPFQLFKNRDKHLQHLDRARQYRTRRPAVHPGMQFVFSHPRLDRQIIQLPDHQRIGENVAKNVLAVSHVLFVGETLQNRLARHVVQVSVAESHRVEQHIQFQVLDQRFAVLRQSRLEIEIAIPVHEKGFHGLIRPRICRRVRPYFSAIDIA